MNTVPATPRYDVYGAIHKALRALMSDTLLRVGRLDTRDAAELARTCDEVDAMLAIFRGHLDHENTYIHPALQAAQPGSADRIAGEHVEHLQAITSLEAQVATVRRDASPEAALRLYHACTLFVAENLAHMHFEETAHHAVLWAHYSDAELAAIIDRLQASVPPDEMGTLLRWMLPSIDPATRAGMMGEMRGAMPAPVFDGVLGLAQAHLDASQWRKLRRDLALDAHLAAA